MVLGMSCVGLLVNVVRGGVSVQEGEVGRDEVRGPVPAFLLGSRETF